MRPWEFARLTDHQIEHLYRRPVRRRAAELSRTAPGGPSPAGATDEGREPDAAAEVKRVIEQGQAPSRTSMVHLFRLFGMPAEEANRQYDEQLRQWQEQQARKGK